MEGLSLLKILIESTGLPANAVEREVNKLLAQRNLKPENVSLDDVREILISYLQDVLVEAKSATP
jgi:hypothetical protein